MPKEVDFLGPIFLDVLRTNEIVCHYDIVALNSGIMATLEQ